jgi:hypothetical protein
MFLFFVLCAPRQWVGFFLRCLLVSRPVALAALPSHAVAFRGHVHFH